MLKALGLGKKNSNPCEDDISKLKYQEEFYKKLKENVAGLINIKENLDKKYAQCKGDFALSRYEDLKKMIKNAISDYKVIASDIKEIPHTSTIPRKSTESYTNPKLGSINRLKSSAHQFAVAQESRKENDSYHELSSKEVNHRIEHYRRQVSELKQEFYSMRDKFEVLSKSYEDSKKYNPAQRYTEMKNMIKFFVKL